MCAKAVVPSDVQEGQRAASFSREGQYARSTISSKGQMTLPVEVRKRLGIRAGDQVDFVFEDGRTVLRPVRSEENPFKQWVGVARGSFKDLAEINAWIREMRGYDEDEDQL